MIESQLTELLERAGEQTAVGPPPMDALRAGAARRRRRRTAAWSALSAAAVVAVVATTLLVPHGRGSGDPPVPAGTSESPPVAMRVVGFGHLAVAVPKTWGTNQAQCGTPQKDTVLIDDPSAMRYCMAARPAGVESIQLTIGPPDLDWHADETFEIDGVQAKRQRTTCDIEYLNVEVCSAVVSIPSLRVWFRADSSTSAEEVDRLLDRIVLVPDQVGVPSTHGWLEPGRRFTAPMYAAELTKLGLKPRIQTTKSPSYSAGDILGVVPTPGTMLAPGATVTITAAGR